MRARERRVEYSVGIKPEDCHSSVGAAKVVDSAEGLSSMLQKHGLTT